MLKPFQKAHAVLGEAESSEDTQKSSELLQAQFVGLANKKQSVANNSAEFVELSLQQGYILLDLEKNSEAHLLAHECFTLSLQMQDWQRSVEACDIIYLAEQDDAITALANGIWLSVTFPIDPELSIAMLNHLIDDSPDRSDGSAVAAAMASYLVDLRVADDKRRNDLKFFVMQLMGDVARRHSQVDSQDVFDFWVQQLELDDPAKFIPRLGSVVDTLADGKWWYDRDALRQLIPQEA
jgi:hypothetical protein